MNPIFVTTDEIIQLWRKMSVEELERAEALIPIVESALIEEAKKVNKDLVKLGEESVTYLNVVKSVVVDVVARTLMTSTENEPMTQYSQSALGYSVSGTFLVPGGGLFIKNSELSRLGLRRQRYGAMELYDVKD